MLIEEASPGILGRFGESLSHLFDAFAAQQQWQGAEVNFAARVEQDGGGVAFGVFAVPVRSGNQRSFTSRIDRPASPRTLVM